MILTLRKLYTLGLHDALSTYDAFKLQIVNRLTILCIGIVFILITINILFQNYVGIGIDLIALTIVPLPVLLLNKRRKYDLATSVFLFGYHVTLIAGTYHSIMEGRNSGLEYMFIPGTIAIIILLSGVGQYIAVALNFLFLAILSYIRFTGAGGDLPEYAHLMAILSIAYLAVYYFVLNFKTRLFRTLENTEKLNLELVGKEEALLDSNRAKDRLFSIVAHDLRSPLALIQGLLQPAILNSMSKEEYLMYSDKVRTKVEAVQKNMNGLLEWAQSQLESLTVNAETVVLKDGIDDIVTLFADILDSKNIRLMYDGSEDTAYLDRNQFIIIIRNIIHNAIKFTPQNGEVHIATQKIDSDVCIKVSDSGMGIDGETRDRILNGKLIEASTGTAGEKGSGIGLSFCQELLKKNKGRLEILKAEPSGTIFKIWLPTSSIQ